MKLKEWKKEFIKKCDDIVNAHRDMIAFINKAEFIDSDEDIDDQEVVDFISLKLIEILGEVDKITK